MVKRGRSRISAAVVALGTLLVARAHGGTLVLARSGDATVDGERLATLERPAAASDGSVAFVGATGALLVRDGPSSTVLARTGDALPAPLAGSFNAFGGTAISGGGAVAFRATLDSTAADEGIFLYRDGTLTAVALGGGAAGDPDGIGDPQLNEALDVAWQNRRGIRLWTAASGTVVGIADRGGAVPPNGTYRRFGRRFALNDAGAMAFAAEVRKGTSGLFVVPRGGVAREFLTSADLLERRVSVAMNGKGQIAFTDGRGRSLRLYEPTAPLKVLAQRHAAVEGVGRLRAVRDDWLALDDAGRALFLGRVDAPGPDFHGALLASEGRLTAVSDATGATPTGHLSPGGRIVWAAAGELFAYEGGRVRLVGRGDPTPLGPGVVVQSPSVNDTGTVAFAAEREALYVVTGAGVRAVLRGGDVVDGAGLITAFGAHAVGGGRVAIFVSLDDGRRAVLAGEPGALAVIAVSGMPTRDGDAMALDADVIGLDARRLVFATAITGADGGAMNAVVQVALRSRRLRVLPLAEGRLTRDAAFIPFAPVSVAPPRVALAATTRRADDILVVAGGDEAERVAVAGGRAPRTGGRFRSLGAIAVGARTALFAATVLDGRTDGGIFLRRRGRVRPVLLDGSGVPGGGTVELIGDEDVPLALDGRRGAFVVPVVVDGIPRATLFVTDGRSPAVVVREGDPTPAGTIGPLGAPGSLALAGNRVVCASPLSGAGAASVLFACDDLRCD